jgi:hypothetical protein
MNDDSALFFVSLFSLLLTRISNWQEFTNYSFSPFYFFPLSLTLFSSIMSDCGAPASASVDVDHGDGQDGLNIPLPRSKEQDFIESVSRRPSFMDNLADSRESQFHVQDRSELERYFVCNI